MKKLLLLLLIAPVLGFAQGEQRYADGTATDQQGNTFEWINYGTQDWSIQNAEVVTYRDGTEIPQVTDATQWSNLTTGAWCYYNNDPTKARLYNWFAVMGIHDTDPNTPNKEFTPEGWHVPTDAEWTVLENYLIANGYNYDGTTTGNKIAKAMASTTGWISSTEPGSVGNDQSLNNSSGFNASPVSYRIENGEFYSQGAHGMFWSSSENLNFNWPMARNRYLSYNSQNSFRDASLSTDKNSGLSVRFVRDASSVGAYGILLNGTVSAENNQIKNVADPTEAKDVTTKSYVDNSDSNTYTQAEVDAIISSLQEQIDALQATTGSGTVTDQDGNSYPYLTYGDQVWTVKNAEMVTYRDGTPIPQVTDATEWSNLTTGAWCYYDNDSTKGRLYNWYAIMGIHDTDPNTPNKEFAPEGWHVPTDAEWVTLENYLIANGYNYDGTTTGNKIAKAMASTTGWDSSTNTGAVGNDQSLNNSSGFNAFPEGVRYGGGSDNYEGNNTFFWSSSENNTNGPWYRHLSQTVGNLGRGSGNFNEQNGVSVRFVKDN
ncbi:MAG: fibrobacter succinogenes major paralogous domain-containing protein [Flavobacteriaceae bacterium]|nr:fibrobacter succinogenes major paralogous domain-containing protein [Flavobacteriaceae bacterium]